MAKLDICDRCKQNLEDEATQRGIVARIPKWRTWRIWGVLPTKAGFNDMWAVNQHRIDLCASCTAEFFKFVQSEPPKKRKTVHVRTHTTRKA